MRKWETSDFPLQSLSPLSLPVSPLSLHAPPLSLLPHFLSLVQSFLNFHSTSKTFQSQLQSHLCFPTRFHILLTVLFCVRPVDFFLRAGGGGGSWVGFVYHTLDLIIHAWEYVGVLICQGRFLFINEEEEGGGHTNALTSCFFWFVFSVKACLDICLKE